MSTENLQQLQEKVITNINEIMLENRLILNDYQKSKRYIHFFLIISLLLNISLCGYFFSFYSFDHFSISEDINYLKTRAQTEILYRRSPKGGELFDELIYGDIQNIKGWLSKKQSQTTGNDVFQFLKSSYEPVKINNKGFNIQWLDAFMKSELYNQAIIKNEKYRTKPHYSSNTLFINTLYRWLYTEEGLGFIKNGHIILPDRTIIDPEITGRAYQLFKSVKGKYNKHPSTTTPIMEKCSYDPEYHILELRGGPGYSSEPQQFSLTICGNTFQGSNILYNDKGDIIQFPAIFGGPVTEKNLEFWSDIN